MAQAGGIWSLCTPLSSPHQIHRNPEHEFSSRQYTDLIKTHLIWQLDMFQLLGTIWQLLPKYLAELFKNML